LIGFFGWIAIREWLAAAARMVLASSGARTPGIDGMDKHRLQIKLDQHLDDLRTSLLEESYRPQPVKRIYIPKSNGKLRPLGIPTLTDRIVQRAMLMAMEPIWESDFHRLSYGFRPERSVCIVAACAVVTKVLGEPHCAIGGNPATVVRRGVRWFRNHTFLEQGSAFRQSWEDNRNAALSSIDKVATI